VSRDNARNPRYAQISVFGQVENTLIYNNAVYSSVGSDAPGVRIQFSKLGGSYVRSLHLANNVIQTTGGRTLIDVGSNERQGSNLTFAGNDYWSNGSTPNFVFGNTYNSFSVWQSATGQEKLNGKSVGMFAAPKLIAANQSGALGAEHLADLFGYRTQPASPLIDHGINVASVFGGSSISQDYFGDPTPQGNGFDIGVEEDALPSGWTSRDIGSVGHAGTASNNRTSGAWTLVGSGADFWGTSDSGQFASTTMSGDGSIVARVDSLSAAAAFAKAGVMIRDGSAANAAEVAMMINVNHTAQFLKRTTTGGTTAAVDASTSGVPQWVKIVRSGDTFSGYVSSDGASWHLVSTVTVKMSADVEVGLAVTAHDNSAFAVAEFSHVTVVH
jgi:regulation of enolase protein 1 (concanavalin A-like superfamily)